MGVKHTGSYQPTSQQFNRRAYAGQEFVSGKFEGHSVNQLGDWAGHEGIDASGGYISDYEDGNGDLWRAHVFTCPGDLTVNTIGSKTDNIEYVVIAGGGAGGAFYSAGGGAGGCRTNMDGHPLATGNPAFQVAASTTYKIVVGEGGASAIPASSPSACWRGQMGSDSYFGPPSQPQGITAIGGGTGGINGPTSGPSSPYGPVDQRLGSLGGCGGGTKVGDGAFGINTSTPNSVPYAPTHSGPYTYNSGYPGGSGVDVRCGGGGGISVKGTDATPTVSGTGGAGSQILFAGNTSTTGIGEKNPANGQYHYFGGGGGGGGDTAPAVGGLGGGGTGAYPTIPGWNSIGMSCTGGGGGGNCGPEPPGADTGAEDRRAVNGGPGIVMCRYKIDSVQTGTSKATGGLVSFTPTHAIHTYIHPGTFIAGPTNLSCEYVVVGGGGAGGNVNYPAGNGPTAIGGGGGGGAFVTSTATITGGSTTAIQVGTGGGQQIVYNTPGIASPGQPSFFGPTIVAGGGGGGGGSGNADPGITPNSGGSGGGGGVWAGGGGNNSGGPGPDAISNPGGSGHPKSGGGGGAGQLGGDGDPTAIGRGGKGRQIPATFRNPISTFGWNPYDASYPGDPQPGFAWYVAGGGGGSALSGSNGTGGLGGGGQGGQRGNTPWDTMARGMNGLSGTGGGGAGSAPGPGPSTNGYFNIGVDVNNNRLGSLIPAVIDPANAQPEIYWGAGHGRGGSGIVMIAYPR